MPEELSKLLACRTDQTILLSQAKERSDLRLLLILEGCETKRHMSLSLMQPRGTFAVHTSAFSLAMNCLYLRSLNYLVTVGYSNI